MVDGEPVDIGQVGEIVKVEPGAVAGPARRRPHPGGVQRRPRRRTATVYNVNADTAAAALAVALSAEKLVVLTDVEGLYANWPDSADVIDAADRGRAGAAAAHLSSGMVPKMEACLTRGPGRRPAGARARRPGAALAAAGDLHRRRNRHHGDALDERC